MARKSKGDKLMSRLVAELVGTERAKLISVETLKPISVSLLYKTRMVIYLNVVSRERRFTPL